MNLPILGVDDAGDIHIFNSVSDAESYIEWQDINEWSVYTADGFIMKPSVLRQGFLQPIKTELKCSAESAVDRLRDSIIRYLQPRGYERNPRESLSDLVQFLQSIRQ